MNDDSKESRTSRKRPLEAGRRDPAHEEVVVRVDSHLILIVPQMLGRVERSEVEIGARHHELSRET